MRERTLQKLALQEATPEGWERFRPITKGPAVALLEVAVLGAISVICQAVRLMRGIFASSRL